MSWVAVGVAGYQIISGFQQAEMVRGQAEVQKQIDEFNASLAEYDAWRMEGYGQTQMARYQTQIDQTEAAARVSMAAAGIKDGSIADVAAQNGIVGLANIIDIESQAREKALGYTRQARSIRTRSGINYNQSQTQADSIVGGSIASAAGTVAGSYIKGGGGFSPSEKAGSESGYSLPASQPLSTSDNYIRGSDYLIPD